MPDNILSGNSPYHPLSQRTVPVNKLDLYRNKCKHDKSDSSRQCETFNIKQTMITIFSIPKPFTGHIGIIQKNAIQSWLAIKPEPQIILFGNETGTDQICKEFNLLHIPEIEQNELGTPKVHSAFNKVSQAALHPLMAYINADIIVTGEIKDILGSVQGRFKEFLMVGRRVDLDV
ncbi:MAG: hypothetical protein KC649_05900, partial [Candidatus Omnitrophica bacterium]|nr:hypothetical protein [Candidatus Omnitrophota bacterium]